MYFYSFAGELNRYAVLQATKRRVDEVDRCRIVVDDLLVQLMQFDFRNNALRRKYDSLKYTLKKMEVRAGCGGTVDALTISRLHLAEALANRYMTAATNEKSCFSFPAWLADDHLRTFADGIGFQRATPFYRRRRRRGLEAGRRRARPILYQASAYMKWRHCVYLCIGIIRR